MGKGSTDLYAPTPTREDQADEIFEDVTATILGKKINFIITFNYLIEEEAEHTGIWVIMMLEITEEKI